MRERRKKEEREKYCDHELIKRVVRSPKEKNTFFFTCRTTTSQLVVTLLDYSPFNPSFGFETLEFRERKRERGLNTI